MAQDCNYIHKRIKNAGNDKYVGKFNREYKKRSTVKNRSVCTHTPQIRSRSNFKNLAATSSTPDLFK